MFFWIEDTGVTSLGGFRAMGTVGSKLAIVGNHSLPTADAEAFAARILIEMQGADSGSGRSPGG